MDCFFLAVLGSNVFNSSTYFQASRRKTCITSTAHQIKVAFLLTDELSLQRLERRGSSFRQIFKVATQFKQQLHKHFTPLHMHRNWEREQVPYETKKKLSGWGKKRHIANNLQNGGCGRQNEFQSFSTTSVNGSLSNYDGLCLLEERENLGQCRVRFVLSQESFPWRIHCLRWTRGVCALCEELSLYGFR